MPKKTITIRIDEQLFEKAEARRGGRKKSEFYRNIISDYLSEKPEVLQKKQEIPSDISKENDALKAELSFKDELMKKLKDERLKEMQNQLVFLQLEFQKLSSQLLKLQPAPHKWWEFWK